MYNLKHGFTMIELIFVILITGILSIVVIPKLVETRDNAAAKVCKREQVQLITELVAWYTKYNSFDSIGKMTNISTSTVASAGNGAHGIQEGTGTVGTADLTIDNGQITYLCDGEVVSVITETSNQWTSSKGVRHTDILLTITPAAPTTSTNTIAVRELKASNVISDATGAARIYVIGEQ